MKRLKLSLQKHWKLRSFLVTKCGVKRWSLGSYRIEFWNNFCGLLIHEAINAFTNEYFATLRIFFTNYMVFVKNYICLSVYQKVWLFDECALWPQWNKRFNNVMYIRCIRNAFDLLVTESVRAPHQDNDISIHCCKMQKKISLYRVTFNKAFSITALCLGPAYYGLMYFHLKLKHLWTHLYRLINCITHYVCLAHFLR